MFRTLSLAIALGVIASAPHLAAQEQTPELLEANRKLIETNRKFTTNAPLVHYPPSARAHHLQGSGIYLLQLRSDGAVERVDIVKSTGYRELDDECVATYKKWRFRQNFVAKTHKVRMQITFTMSVSR
jgi:TonB family protein